MQALSRTTLAMGLIVLLTSTAAAHPGHGHEAYPEGVMHWMTSPWHLLPWLAAGLTLAAVLIGRRILRRHRKQQQPVTVSRRR